MAKAGNLPPGEKCRGLERMAGATVAHVAPCQAAEFVADQGLQAVERLLSGRNVALMMSRRWMGGLVPKAVATFLAVIAGILTLCV